MLIVTFQFDFTPNDYFYLTFKKTFHCFTNLPHSSYHVWIHLLIVWLLHMKVHCLLRFSPYLYRFLMESYLSNEGIYDSTILSFFPIFLLSLALVYSKICNRKTLNIKIVKMARIPWKDYTYQKKSFQLLAASLNVRTNTHIYTRAQNLLAHAYTS